VQRVRSTLAVEGVLDNGNDFQFLIQTVPPFWLHGKRQYEPQTPHSMVGDHTMITDHALQFEVAG
jgi:hypothetical protein